MYIPPRPMSAISSLHCAGYAIPVRAVFDAGAVNDDFDPALLIESDKDDPLAAELDRTASAAGSAGFGFARCWPDDLVLLGGSLAPGDGPGALLVPRAHPAIVAALGAESDAFAAAASTKGVDLGGYDDATAQGARFFSHCGVVISIAKHAPPLLDTMDKLRRDVLRGTPAVAPVGVADGGDAPAQQPRAAARLARFVSQQPRFAQPGSLEFDFACEWRLLQVVTVRDALGIAPTGVARPPEPFCRIKKTSREPS